MDNLRTLKSKMKKYDLGQNLRLQLKSLKIFNSWMYAIITFSIIFVIITFVNLFFQFRAHLCLYSNTKKCVASDKQCVYNQKSSNSGLVAELYGEVAFSIVKDTSTVTDQTITIDYYEKDSAGNSKPEDNFTIDFVVESPLPATGTSPLPDYPNAGYQYYSTDKGLSIFLSPFKLSSPGTLSGTSITQMNYIISQAMGADPYGKIAYMSQPSFGFNPTNTNPNQSGIIYAHSSVDNEFYLGTYVQEQTEPTTIPASDKAVTQITNSVQGNSSLFNQYAKTKNITITENETAYMTENVTQQTLVKNVHSRQYCNKHGDLGCACLDPAVVHLPYCGDYYYDATKGLYLPLQKITSGPSVTKFCSHFNHHDKGSTTIAPNISPNTTSSIKNVNKSRFYLNGIDGTPIAFSKSDTKERYNLPAIFCSNTSSLTNYDPKTDNKLYTSGQTSNDWSDVKTPYKSSQPNAKLNSDQTVTLGFN